MRRLRLSTLLVLTVNGLVLAAVAVVAVSATHHLQRLSDEQALARTRFAGQAALAEVESTAEEVSVAARLLAERPTLARLAEQSDREGLSAFLERFRDTSRVSACALLRDGHVVAARGGPLPAAAGAGPSALSLPADARPAILSSAEGPLMIAAAAPVPALAGVSVIVSRSLDAGYARQIEARTGIAVSILDGARAFNESADPRAFLRARALTNGEPSVERVNESGEYVAAVPLRSPAGDVAGLVEARMPTAVVDASLRRLRTSLLLLAGGVAAAATAGGILLGRRLVRPLRDLTEASARIGQGDLATPIARAAGAEAGALAATMEEMRGQLLNLTAELHRRRGEAEAILSGIAEGVFSVDRERRIHYMNPQTAALLGVRASDVHGRFCGDVLHPDKPENERPCEDACPILHARFSGSARAAETLHVAGGLRMVVITSSSPGGGEGDGGPGAPDRDARQFQVVRDETDLEAARRARDAVLANISHEFRTPLAAQLASIELLRDRLPELSVEEGRELVLSLERGSLRLTRLIDNLLESVRIESGRSSIRRQAVALDEVVEEAVQMTGPLLVQRGQQLAVELPWPLPPVFGDAPRLSQVVVNLLANAQKFSPEGSTIRIGAKASPAVTGGAEGAIAEVHLWVEDEGPGLPADAGSLFAPFSRSEGPEPEAGGLGLGLFIARSIVERHGGRIETGAGANGRGARITIILPAAEDRNSPDAADEPERPDGRPEGGADRRVA